MVIIYTTGVLNSRVGDSAPFKGIIEFLNVDDRVCIVL